MGQFFSQNSAAAQVLGDALKAPRSKKWRAAEADAEAHAFVTQFDDGRWPVLKHDSSLKVGLITLRHAKEEMGTQTYPQPRQAPGVDRRPGALAPQARRSSPMGAPSEDLMSAVRPMERCSH